MKNLFFALAVAGVCHMVFAAPPVMVNLLAKQKPDAASLVKGFATCDSAQAIPKWLLAVPLKDGFDLDADVVLVSASKGEFVQDGSKVVTVTYVFDRLAEKSLQELDKKHGTTMTSRFGDHYAFEPMAASAVWFTSHAPRSVTCNRYVK